MNNSLIITNQYPVEKYNLLVSMQTVAEIAEIHKPVMNVVSISTDLNDKEIYVQEKEYTDKYGAHPAKYAIAKKGLTKLMRAAGIKIVYSKPILPSTCQRCVEVNKNLGKAVNCGGCPANKDVKFEVRISVPQLTGENIEIVAHKEIVISDVVVGMSDKQRVEFLKFRNEMCESKALNRALRTAMQIKGTYYLEEFKKPFVVAYLVPNLDNEAVKEKAIESFFSSKSELFGGSNDSVPKKTIFVEDDEEEYDTSEYERPSTPVEESYHTAAPQGSPTPQTAGQADPNVCVCCGAKITNGVSNYSIENFGKPICMNRQRKGGGQ